MAPVARFIKKFQTPRQNWLDLLPNDILVDCVIIYLNIKEVLRLRRVRIQSFQELYDITDVGEIGEQTVL